jgi:hypothetical protein
MVGHNTIAIDLIYVTAWAKAISAAGGGLALVSSMGLVGVAIEIGIEPTARHAADLGSACGSGHAEAAQRSVEALNSPETPFSPTWMRFATR